MCTPTSYSSESEPAAPEGPRPELILASQSPARASILRSSGIAFRSVVSGVDEEAAVHRAEEERGGRLDPGEEALVLARAKAEAVALLPETRGCLVLGCDSVFELNGRTYGKPHTAQRAAERIREMSGSTGRLHTGHWLVDRRKSEGQTDPGTGETRCAEVTFDVMTDEQIEAYVSTGEPLEVAGSFTIEGYGAAFISGISGESHTVLGLSVNALKELLRRRDLEISRFWTRNA